MLSFQAAFSIFNAFCLACAGLLNSVSTQYMLFCLTDIDVGKDAKTEDSELF